MAMTLRKYLINASIRMSDDEGFRSVYEDHLTYFKTHSSTESVPVTPMQLHIHNFSWIGLLTELRIPMDMHWFVIRLNGGESYVDTPKEIDTLLIPNAARIKAMYSVHISRKTKNKTT